MLTEINTVTGAEPQPESQEYIDKMVAKADGIETPPANEQQKEEEEEKLYAGKYKSIEELEKGYQELQKAFSSKKPTTTKETSVNDTLKLSKEEEEPASTEAEEILESKGLDISIFQQEFAEKGELTEASYEALAKAGIPKEYVDSYIEGERLRANLAVTRVYDTVGGEEEFIQLKTWASQSLPQERIQAFDDVVSTGDVEKIVLAVRGLKSEFETLKGKTPNLILGDVLQGNSVGGAFTSKAQMTAAMSDKRYEKDPAYRDEVMQKIARSNLF